MNNQGQGTVGEALPIRPCASAAAVLAVRGESRNTAERTAFLAPKNRPRAAGLYIYHGLLAVLLWTAGCIYTQPAPIPVRDHLATGDKTAPSNSPSAALEPPPNGANKLTTARGGPTPREAPAPPAASGPPIAEVNGAPIPRSELVDLLLTARGLPLLQQLILLRLAEQETARLNLQVSNEDVRREYDLTIQADRFNGKDPEALTPARREQLIEQWTSSRGISREELAIAIRRQAHLRKLAEPHVRIDEAMLREEYHRQHDEKVEVRHVQLASPRAYDRFKAALENGEDFEKLVLRFSQNTMSLVKGGLLPPFSRNDDTVPPIFAETAFALSPGQVSNPFEVEGSLNVIRLERRIPADGVPFDRVREKIKKNLRARLIARQMEQLGQRLMLRAKLRILEPRLREQYEDRRRAGDLIGPPLSGG